MSEASSPRRPGKAATGERAARPTLAARLAERSRQRALRAERLARLRPPPAPRRGPRTDEAETALQEFLRALTGELPGVRREPAAAGACRDPRPGRGAELPAPGAAVKLVEGQRTGVSDLEALPGVGPNLVWALEQAGIGCLADLVPLAPEELVAPARADRPAGAGGGLDRRGAGGGAAGLRPRAEANGLKPRRGSSLSGGGGP